jgi:hypothetical protein
MHECIDSTEDALLAKICSGSQGCGGLEPITYGATPSRKPSSPSGGAVSTTRHGAFSST